VTTATTSYSSLQRESLKEAVKRKMDFDASGVLDVISVGFKSSVDQSVAQAYEKTVEEKTETSTSYKLTETFHVGAHSVVSMYRLVYSGPGVSYATETVSSTPMKMDDVVIDLKVKQRMFLQSIDVVYTDSPADRPRNLITDDIYGQHDINKGVANSGYTWLVPVWTRSLVSL